MFAGRKIGFNLFRGVEELKTILIIDDDPSHLKLYSWVLNRAGYRAVTALVGSSSVSFPSAARVNLAILDYRLQSQLKAQDVLKQVRAQFNGVPVILLSELQWMPKDMENLVDAFQQKGNPELLLSKIAELTPGNEDTQSMGYGGPFES